MKLNEIWINKMKFKYFPWIYFQSALVYSHWIPCINCKLMLQTIFVVISKQLRKQNEDNPKLGYCNEFLCPKLLHAEQHKQRINKK